ncbi:cache domain-containing protein [uncultured Pseudacidovorax sp.]|uniref:cache domain-containing protein n=1 Tax=uncultured Pseudacidovorax sp. TaxID=679313 RepID=UPI0025E0288F|nr:cache domain-containing protein [uncultured Pseudacidovorax sp.]
MTLRTKIIALAVLPLLAALGMVAFGLQHQSRDLHRRERLLIEQSHMAQRRSELRSYVDLGLSVIRPLYQRGDDAATRQEALRLLGTLDYGNDGYFFVYDLQGHVLMHSRQPELIGQSLWDLRDSQGRYTIRDLIARARAGGGYVEYEWRKPSVGSLAPKLGYVQALDRWQWMVGTGLYLDDIQATLDALDAQTSGNVSGTLLWIAAIATLSLAAVSAGGLLLNLSEYRVAEAKLRQLARRVVQSQEEERAHLARELHDGTSQTLVSAKLLVESAVDGLQREGQPVPPLLVRALQRLGEALLEVRHISHRLRPALLDTLGLPAALERLVDEAGGAGPTVALQVTGDARALSAEAKTALFRVAQEALTNIQKHAGAAHVDLHLHVDTHGVRLTVTDDGLGFDVEAAQADPHRGLGLRHMRERMEAAGGRLRLQSAPGHTTVTAELPHAFEEDPA